MDKSETIRLGEWLDNNKCQPMPREALMPNNDNNDNHDNKITWH